ncbi:MAG: class I SAM-dependent methyltransferase [Caldilineales bacterium]|nr:class I SAM-dependent methyltransferase [Caldilineales bacterium]
MKVSASEIDTVSRFSSKAATYAAHRWDYDPRAFDEIVQTVGLTPESVVADIGAGPGNVSRRLLGRVGRVYAVEPNAEMRRAAALSLGDRPNLVIISASAEATTLPDQSIDLITVGRAIHWFDPEPTRREFRRIMHPGGWLAILKEDRSGCAIEEEARTLHVEELGWRTQDSKANLDVPPLESYFDDGGCQTFRFSREITETFEQFLDRQTAYSPAPDADHPLRPAFDAHALALFDRYAEEGHIHLNIVTLLHLGRIS